MRRVDDKIKAFFRQKRYDFADRESPRRNADMFGLRQKRLAVVGRDADHHVAQLPA